MHPLFQSVLDDFASDTVVAHVGIPITQQNLVLVIYYGKTASIQNSYVEHHSECRSSRETFPSLTCRFGRPKVTMMQFPSGMTVFVGGPNYASTLFVALVYRIKLERFRRLYTPDIPKESLVFGHPNKANLVFTAQIPGAPFDLAKFYANKPGVRYNPRKFPGANLMICNSSGVMLGTAVFFDSGLLNFMGCRSALDAQYAVDYLAAELAPFACSARGVVEKIVDRREQEKEQAIIDARENRLRAPALNYTDVLDRDEDDLMKALLEGEENLCLE